MKVLFASYRPVEEYRGSEESLVKLSYQSKKCPLCQLIDKVGHLVKRLISPFVRNYFMEETAKSVRSYLSPTSDYPPSEKSFVVIERNQKILLVAHTEEGEKLEDFANRVSKHIKQYFPNEVFGFKETFMVTYLSRYRMEEETSTELLKVIDVKNALFRSNSVLTFGTKGEELGETIHEFAFRNKERWFQLSEALADNLKQQFAQVAI